MGIFSRVKTGVQHLGSRVKKGVKSTASRVKKGVKSAVKTGEGLLKKAAGVLAKGREIADKIIGGAKKLPFGPLVIDLLKDTPIEKILLKGDAMAKNLATTIEKALNVMEDVDKLAEIKSPKELLEKTGSAYASLDSEAKNRVENFVGTVMKKAPKLDEKQKEIRARVEMAKKVKGL